MQETCGSVCGMIFLAGLKNSDGNMEQPKSKLETFKLGKKMIEAFTEMNTSVKCNILRGTDGATDRIRSCNGCVEEYLFPEEFEK